MMRLIPKLATLTSTYSLASAPRRSEPGPYQVRGQPCRRADAGSQIQLVGPPLNGPGIFLNLRRCALHSSFLKCKS